jgi:predicted MFS family arabinose efflux permease
MFNPAAPFRVALRARDARLLLTGLAASEAGDWLYNLALLALVYDRTGSSAWVGVATAARMLPLVALGPLAGVLADRVDRRRLMIGSDLVRCACMAALAAVAATAAPIVLAPALAALSAAAGAAYPSCVVGLIPRLVADEDLPAVNAARVSITHLCVIAGPVLGAALLLLGSAFVAFAVNGVTFLAGAVVVAALPRDALRRPAAAPGPHAGLRAELLGGWRALRAYPESLPLVCAEVVASAAYGALTVLLVLVSDRLGLGAAGYGYLVAAIGAGGVLAAGVADRAAASGRPRFVLAVAVLALAAPLPVVAVAGWLPGVLVLIAVFGGASLVTEVVADTALQRSLDPAVFARAYGLVLPAALAGIAAGALLAPPCVSLVGVDGTLVLVAAVAAACGGAMLAAPPRAELVTTA